MSETGTHVAAADLRGRVSVEESRGKIRNRYLRIHRAKLDGQLVAVTVITVTIHPELSKKKLRREINFWRSLSHSNLIPLQGFVEGEEFGSFGAIISPWYTKGDGPRYLSENGQRMLVADRIKLWRGVVNGVEYLHGHNPPIIHGDLRPRNILIDTTGEPRISDWGLTRLIIGEIHESDAADNEMAALLQDEEYVRYLAPEQLAGDRNTYSTASDVYMLGCTGLEFIYREKPYSNNKYGSRAVKDRPKGSLPAVEPLVDDWPAIVVWPLLVKCWKSDPAGRPSAAAAITTLEYISRLKEPQNLTSQISIDKENPEIRGNLSFIYLGQYENKAVAVKVLKLAGKSETMKRKLNREMTIWANVDHRNILAFLGFANDQAFSPFGALVSPWCKNGDSADYLEEHGERMGVTARIDLWRGVVAGIAYLHGQIPSIIHGDLKPKNVLIDDNVIPKICDFGLARIYLEEGSTGMTTTAEHTGTERYLAPELVSSGENVYPTMECDVYALGCVGLEYIYRQRPFNKWKHNKFGHIITDLKAGSPPAASAPETCSASIDFWNLLVELWKREPGQRPSTAEAFTKANSL